MISTTSRTGKNRADLKRPLAEYRYKIFIEQLGWQLPTKDGLEQDDFDSDETLYVVGQSEDNTICGCARLLSTSSPYLLSEVFPFLMGTAKPP